MRKIAIANRKGGVGKTTTAVNVSAGLALAGNKVLLIDTDTQGHCSRLLGVNPEKGLAELIDGTVTPSEALIEAREGLFLLAGSRLLAGISRLIVKTEIHKATKVLSNVLKPFDGKFDYVLLDTSPGFNELSVNVFFYADEILIPVSMEVLAIDGFKDFMREMNELSEYSNIEIRYITPTFVDGRVKKTEDVLEHLQKHFPDKLTPLIHYSTKLSESPAWGKTIYEFAGRERASKDYAKLTGAIT